ncbi:MAG: hypothetical protein WCS15_09395 [Prevotella sp.]
MAIFVRKNSKWHALTGAQVAKNGVFHTVKWNDKAYFGGIGYQSGFGTVEPVPPSSDVTPPTFNLDTEPTGTIWYITPTGAGTKDGTSWANASNNLPLLLLGCSAGDSVYIMEGEYSQANTLTIPDGVSIYGGFDTGGLWADRDSFENHSKFVGTGTLFYCETPAVGQIIDGVSMSGYDEFTGNGNDISFKNIYVVDSTITFYCDIGNCIFKNSAVVTSGSVSDCCFDNDTDKNIGIDGSATNCSFNNCLTSQSQISLVGTTATDCLFNNCTTTYASLVGTTATDCTFYNCKTTGSSLSMIKTTATRCVFYGCVVLSNYSLAILRFIGTTATDCTFYNCVIKMYESYTGDSHATSYIVGDDATRCSFYNCEATCFTTGTSQYVGTYSGIVAQNATECLFCNCLITSSESSDSKAFIVGTTITNCLIAFCKASFLTKSGETSQFCTFIYNDGALLATHTNCVAFNNSSSFTTNQTNCAQSVFHASNELTIGTDNSIAKFTSLPVYDSVGVQDAGDCPNPATDETGFNAWVASFGDYEPETTSFLKGKGVDIAEITTDLNNKTRLSPPTIGACEAKGEV